MVSFSYVGHMEAPLLNWDSFITSYKLPMVALKPQNRAYFHILATFSGNDTLIQSHQRYLGGWYLGVPTEFCSRFT